MAKKKNNKCQKWSQNVSPPARQEGRYCGVEKVKEAESARKRNQTATGGAARVSSAWMTCLQIHAILVMTGALPRKTPLLEKNNKRGGRRCEAGRHTQTSGQHLALAQTNFTLNTPKLSLKAHLITHKMKKNHI